MIPHTVPTHCRERYAPWLSDDPVEQDLALFRALIELHS